MNLLTLRSAPLLLHVNLLPIREHLPGWKRWAVLLLMAMMLWQIWEGMELRKEHASYATRAAETRRLTSPSVSPPPAPLEIARLKAAAQLAQRLRISWPNRLAALRRAHGDGVVLQGFDLGNAPIDVERAPQGSDGAVDVLTGRARDLLALINYLGRLNGIGQIERAELRRHGPAGQSSGDPNAQRAPLAFEIRLKWKSHGDEVSP